MYKLIALDLDGTLLNDDRMITSENLNIIHDLTDKGYEVVIATGRNYYSAKVITKNINEHLIYICNNGNIVRDAIDDRVISTTFLNSKDSKIILQEGIARKLFPFIHVDYYQEGYDILVYNNLNFKKRNPSKEAKLISRIKIIEEKSDEKMDRVLSIVYPGELDMLYDFHLSINNMHPNRFNSHIMEHATETEALLEIMNPQGTKWNALIKYANTLGIEADEIIAIGDNNNDIEMIINAGLGIVMKNGSKLAKEVADLVSERDNNESGVAFELKKILNIS